MFSGAIGGSNRPFQALQPPNILVGLWRTRRQVKTAQFVRENRMTAADFLHISRRSVNIPPRFVISTRRNVIMVIKMILFSSVSGALGWIEDNIDRQEGVIPRGRHDSDLYEEFDARSKLAGDGELEKNREFYEALVAFALARKVEFAAELGIELDEE